MNLESGKGSTALSQEIDHVAINENNEFHAFTSSSHNQRVSNESSLFLENKTHIGDITYEKIQQKRMKITKTQFYLIMAGMLISGAVNTIILKI